MKNHTLTSEIRPENRTCWNISVRYTALYLLFTLCLLYAFYLLSIFLPGFRGKVTDNRSGTPIKDAYVIVFTEIRPFKYLFFHEVPHSIHVTKTDKDGRFRIDNYYKFYPGLVGSRQIFLYKHDYYASHYLQENTLHLREHHHLDVPSTTDRALRIFDTNEFQLAKETQEVNSVESLLEEVRRFTHYLMSENKELSLPLRPALIDLYTHFNNESDHIKGTLKKKHIIDNWERGLRSLKGILQKMSAENRT